MSLSGACLGGGGGVLPLLEFDRKEIFVLKFSSQYPYLYYEKASSLSYVWINAVKAKKRVDPLVEISGHVPVFNRDFHA